MPIYEYHCNSCGRRSEELQGMNDPPLDTCRECDGDLKKLISAPAFQFKGTGWYVTDYAKKDNRAEGSGESSSSSEGGKSSTESEGGSPSTATEAGSSSSSSSESKTKPKTKESSA